METREAVSELDEKWADVIEALDRPPSVRSRAWILLTMISALVFFVADNQKYSTELAFIVLLVVAIHELGHYLVMRWYGMSDATVFFVPFIGAGVWSKKLLGAQGLKLVYISMAGPVPGIIIGTVLYMFSTNIPLFRVAGLNFLFINGINLLPFLLLDGAKIFKGLFFLRWPWGLLFFQLLTLLVVYFFIGRWAVLFVPMVALSHRISSSAMEIVEMLRERYPSKDWVHRSLTRQEWIEILEFISPGYRKRGDRRKLLPVMEEVREILKVERPPLGKTLLLFGVYLLALAIVLGIFLNEPQVLAAL
ncbi:MAG: hypothetical protein K2Q26_04670 [Bdellovibrionales bacterium]|nr:hypothetical protein [Bdellovibrionales bacterium]